jgi:hypothetical protein
MADPELVDYIRKNIAQYGADALLDQLKKDGVSPEDIKSALEEAQNEKAPSITLGTANKPLPKKPKSKLALFAVLCGAVLIVSAGLLSLKKPPPAPLETERPSAPADPDIADTLGADDGDIFRGHYGYMLKLPPEYETFQQFLDPKKTQERVYIFPKGTSHQHFINEGLFGPMGILRLDVTRRRVPQGFIGIETLKAWIKGKLETEKATYTIRETMVQSMPAFIVNVEKPFKITKAYVVGQKVRYEITGGEENTVFTSTLSSLYEASPHDRPGQ